MRDLLAALPKVEHVFVIDGPVTTSAGIASGIASTAPSVPPSVEEAVEVPLAQPIALVRRDAGPVVGDLQPNKRVRFGECDGDAVFGVLLGVVHEVANHAVQLLGIPLKNHRRRAAEHCHLDVNAANTAGSLGRDLGEVDRLAWTLLM